MVMKLFPASAAARIPERSAAAARLEASAETAATIPLSQTAYTAAGSGLTAIGGKADVSGSASSVPADEVIKSFRPESWTEGYVRENVDGRKKTILRADPVPAGANQEETRVEYYNFGTEASPDWDSYTEISTEQELLDLAGTIRSGAEITSLPEISSLREDRSPR